jgi:hypothetical protein
VHLSRDARTEDHSECCACPVTSRKPCTTVGDETFEPDLRLMRVEPGILIADVYG